jgi:CRISPR/Cas system CSM-associated protein Csm2 small subunit
MVMTEKEQEIVQTIEKLKKQLYYHGGNDCPASRHSEFLEQAIDELRQQLEQVQNNTAYASMRS